MNQKIGIGVTAVALIAAAAWTTDTPHFRTDPAPVDVILEDVERDAATGEASVSPAVRLSATALRPRAEWDLPKTYNDRVQYWIDYLSGANRDRMRLWLEREGRYGPMLRERLAERGMPQDLVYLAMIESGLSPKAYSHAHASGMWQFIAETGRRYGLEVTPFVDERRDPVRATEAALDYLTDLHERFGSWYLAAAGYNSGENRVDRILRQRMDGQKGRESLFWMIDEHLPRETRDYVPLMLAAAHIGKDPARYGFHEIALEAPLEYDEIVVPGGISLAAIAETSGTDLKAIAELNTHFLQGMTPPGGDQKLRVPVGAGDRVLAGLEDLGDKGRLGRLVHQVRRGETLSHIARRYGVRQDMLIATNGHLNPRRLQVGQQIHVPVVDGRGGAELAEKAAWKTYRVRRGDSLWAIARRHGVSVTEIRRWNGIGNRIQPGQRIRIQA